MTFNFKKKKKKYTGSLQTHLPISVTSQFNFQIQNLYDEFLYLPASEIHHLIIIIHVGTNDSFWS
uniref:Uncharacterized protein n=1 Tax=Helianthus annuus TaxID=4232 RepID=A0A251UCF5_HELAN